MCDPEPVRTAATGPRPDESRAAGDAQPVGRQPHSDAATARYHDAFYSQREKDMEALGEAYKSYDQALITLSAGALGVSVSFVKDFVPRPLPFTAIFLFLSWVGFGASLVLILASFRSSQESLHRHLELQDAAFNNYGTPTDGENPARDRTKDFNNWSFYAFVAAVAFLVLFSILNYHGISK